MIALAEQLVVVGMCADPSPDEQVALEPPESPVRHADSHAPQIGADLREVQRGMEGVALPEPVGGRGMLANLPWHRPKRAPEPRARDARDRHRPASSRSSASRSSSGRQWPAATSAWASAMSPSSRPAAASAAIWRSQSSSVAGWSIAINSAYSRGLSLSMAALISRSVVMPASYPAASAPGKVFNA